MKKYLESSKYLPKLNNEIPGQRNSTYKERFASLHNLVLIMVRSPQNNISLIFKSIESCLDDHVLFYSLKTIRSLFQKIHLGSGFTRMVISDLFSPFERQNSLKRTGSV